MIIFYLFLHFSKHTENILCAAKISADLVLTVHTVNSSFKVFLGDHKF
jgi:hypothetical protein